MPADFDQTCLEIDVQQVKAKLDSGESILLLDCREQDEYDLVHLANSVLLPMSDIQNRLDELNSYRDIPLIVYCHFGGRSLQVAQWLQHQGFDDVLSMSGGIDAWAEQIDPSMQRY